MSTKSTPNSPFARSLSVDPKSNLSPKYKMSQRPKLKRETAQDIEDEDCVNDHKMVHLSPNSLLKPTKQKQLIHQKSAPGKRTIHRNFFETYFLEISFFLFFSLGSTGK